MPSPWKHPKTGVYWFRCAVPADLRGVLKRRDATPPSPGGDVTTPSSTSVWRLLGRTTIEGEAVDVTPKPAAARPVPGYRPVDIMS